MNSEGSEIDSKVLKCPECRALLKRRRSRKADVCEMVCGGCGKLFDICDATILEEIKRTSNDISYTQSGLS